MNEGKKYYMKLTVGLENAYGEENLAHPCCSKTLSIAPLRLLYKSVLSNVVRVCAYSKISPFFFLLDSLCKLDIYFT